MKVCPRREALAGDVRLLRCSAGRDGEVREVVCVVVAPELRTVFMVPDGATERTRTMSEAERTLMLEEGVCSSGDAWRRRLV